MYEAYWGLTSKPFSSGGLVVRSQSQHAAVLRLNYAFEASAEAAVVLGSSGLGKSTVVRLLQAEDPERRRLVHLLFPSLAPIEQLRTIAGELNPGQSGSQDAAGCDTLLLSIRSALRRLFEDGRQAIVCFDDAHLLSTDVLVQTVQPLLNLADSDGRVDLCVVLAGQPVLLSRLARQPQLNERIGVLATLQGFGHPETVSYVAAQLAASGCSQRIFTADALTSLYELSQGNPRRLNRLCDMSLLVGFADRRAQVTEREVEAVAAELLPVAA